MKIDENREISEAKIIRRHKKYIFFVYIFFFKFFFYFYVSSILTSKNVHLKIERELRFSLSLPMKEVWRMDEETRGAAGDHESRQHKRKVPKVKF